MESPVRKLLKRNDYNRHKLLRKIKRRRKAAAEQLAHAAEKELKRRLRITPPRFEGGKNPKDIDITYVDNPTYNEELGLFKDDNGRVVGDSVVLPELNVTPQLSRANEFRDQRKRFHYEQPLETVSPEFEALMLGRGLWNDVINPRSFIKQPSNITKELVTSPEGRRFELNKSLFDLDDVDYSKFYDELYDAQPHDILKLIDDYPSLYKDLIEKEAGVFSNIGDDPKLTKHLNDVLDFYRRDVYPRLTNADADAGYISKLTLDRLKSSTPGLDNVRIKQLAFSNGEFNGFASGNTSYLTQSQSFPTNKFNIGAQGPLTIAHELRHNLGNYIRSLRAKGRGAYGYTFNEEEALNNAYKFSDGFLNKNSDVVPIKEMAATNTELRYKLYKMYNLFGKLESLDRYIDEIPYNQLLDHLKNINGYGQDFVNTIYNAASRYKDPYTYNLYLQYASDNIKHALKYVGAYSAPATIAGTAIKSQSKKK